MLSFFADDDGRTAADLDAKNNKRHERTRIARRPAPDARGGVKVRVIQRAVRVCPCSLTLAPVYSSAHASDRTGYVRV